MIYPQNFENKIEFDKIRELIKNKCKGKKGKELVSKMSFTNDIDFIKQELAKTSEMLDICMLKKEFPSISYPETDNILIKLKTDNYCLLKEEIVDLRTLLELTKGIKKFFSKQNEGVYLILKELVSNIDFPDFVYDRINAIFSKTGEIKDNASSKLKNIRNNLRICNKNVISKSESILKEIRLNSWIDPELSPTLVNGRLVLPIESTHKRKIKGLIHDESASGKTSYIEPQEIVELNNKIRELELEENRELFKILFELTNDIRPYFDNFTKISEIISELDFLQAKSLFSISIEAIIPAVDEKPGLDIIRAKHPLLLLTLKKDNKNVVPLSLKIDSQNRILLISGPNAGGKSVALKTIGLICYMTQCGLPVPIGGASVIGVFNNVYIDMGDDQSIDNDLSTYSSHLNNMKYFLKNCNNNSLILIDEFGSGTEPIIGGNIAEAILQELNMLKTFGIITTHYSNLKIFASNTDGIQNAAMLIDNNKMIPLFILEQGLPGSSYALEIAARTGLPENIIENIKVKTGNEKANFDKFLRKVLKDKRYWERKRQNIRQKEKQVEETLEKYLKDLEKLKNEKKIIINNAKQEAENILREVNKKIENTIRVIKETKADKKKTLKARKEIEIIKDNIQNNKNSLNIDNISEKVKKIEKVYQQYSKKSIIPKSTRNSDKQLRIGSHVKIIGQTNIGEVIEINNDNIVICFGNIFTSISKDNVELIENSDIKKTKSSIKKQKIYNQTLLNFKPYIDIRGHRVEEAINIITEFIDNAVMLDFKELKILHGKGNGILRQEIRKYLKTFPYINNVYDEDIRLGGDGITIVKIEN